MRWYFLLFGLINLLALGVALLLSLTVIVDYFSYFTILSNILITVVFLTLGASPLKTLKKNMFIQNCYGPAVLYMCITGIVYWTILHGGKQLTTDVEWITLVLHGLMPIAVVVGWVVFPIKTYTWKSVAMWLIFPLTFVVYTLFRGVFVHWYPYPFLNPTIVGYRGVGEWTLGILVGAFLVGNTLLFLAKLNKSK